MVMAQITVLCVGRCKEAYWRDAVAEYQKRMNTLCKLQIIEVDAVRLPDNPSAAQIAQALTAEGEILLSKIPAGSFTIALCVEGKMLSSEQLADRLRATAVDGFGRVTLVIGSSYGMSDEVKQKANLRLSMSPMTFPHQLARVMLLEQLYRAMKMLDGGTYHK